MVIMVDYNRIKLYHQATYSTSFVGSPNSEDLWSPQRSSFALHICYYQMCPGFKCFQDLIHFYILKEHTIVFKFSITMALKQYFHVFYPYTVSTLLKWYILQSKLCRFCLLHIFATIYSSLFSKLLVQLGPLSSLVWNITVLLKLVFLFPRQLPHI